LLPVMKHHQEPEKSVYVEYFQGGRTPEHADFVPSRQGRIRGQMQVIRLGDKVGVRYDIQSHKDDFEIYDVMQDPQQKYNIDLTEESTDLQQHMKDQVLRMRRPDENAPRPYDAEYLPALSGISGDFDSGLRMAVYETNSRWIPQVGSMEPLYEEISSQINIPDFDSGNVLEFSGMVYVPSSGEYTLQIQTEHATIVRLHDALLIDADFHRDDPEEKSGNIRLAS